MQADLKTFHAFGCYGMAVVTTLTAQNTVGVRAVHEPPAAFVSDQLGAVLEDCPPAATKTGMLFSREVIEVVVRCAENGALGPLIVDPVMVATSGDRLLQPGAESALRERLLPLAMLVTPNLPEAAVLLESSSLVGDAPAMARALAARLTTSVLLTGGHGEGDSVCDTLATPGGDVRVWQRPRLPVGDAHGTGCTLSAGIAAGFALGLECEEAIERAGAFVHRGLEHAFPVGAGAMPVNHLRGNSAGTR